LQERGHECVGIDISPLAVKVCKERGANDARIMSITQISPHLGQFDSIVMFGNNFGLMGGRRRAKWLLPKLHRMTTDNARIIAVSGDPYPASEPAHLQYQKLNRRRGRMGGQVRIRIRYKKYVSPWFDYLLASHEEMVDLLADTGWRVKTFIDSGAFYYAAIIEKT
jgi:hypothetical protein